MDPITSEQFEFINDWNLGDQRTKDLIRDGGWRLTGGPDGILEEYMNVTTLGAFDAETDKAYYLQEEGGTPIEMVFNGEVNQAVQIYSHSTLDDFNYRNYFVIYLRIQGKTYASYDLITEQNIEALTYQRYAMPLSNAIDLNIDADDNTIQTDPDYTGMSITFLDTPRSETIGEGTYNFSIVIDGNGQSIQKIYEFVQWSLREDDNINADTEGDSILGLTADDMLQFVGPTLFTLYTSYNGGSGVFIENFNEVDTNDIRFRHDGSATEVVRFPFVAAGRINFNDNLTAATGSKYVMFFTDGFDTIGATIVKDANNEDITGTTYQKQDVVFTYDYDGNDQRGLGTEGTDAPVTVVAIGTTMAQYVRATGVIAESVQNVITLVAPLERNYTSG